MASSATTVIIVRLANWRRRGAVRSAMHSTLYRSRQCVDQVKSLTAQSRSRGGWAQSELRDNLQIAEDWPALLAILGWALNQSDRWSRIDGQDGLPAPS